MTQNFAAHFSQPRQICRGLTATPTKGNTTKRKLTPEVKAARKALRDKGYTYASASKALNRSVSHIATVLTLNGRTSISLLKRIHALPSLTESA